MRPDGDELKILRALDAAVRDPAAVASIGRIVDGPIQDPKAAASLALRSAGDPCELIKVRVAVQQCQPVHTGGREDEQIGGGHRDSNSA